MALADQIFQIRALQFQGRPLREIAEAVGVEMGDVESVLGGGSQMHAEAVGAGASVPYGDFQEHGFFNHTILVPAHTQRTIVLADTNDSDRGSLGAGVPPMSADGSFAVTGGLYVLTFNFNADTQGVTVSSPDVLVGWEVPASAWWWPFLTGQGEVTGYAEHTPAIGNGGTHFSVQSQKIIAAQASGATAIGPMVITAGVVDVLVSAVDITLVRVG